MCYANFSNLIGQMEMMMMMMINFSVLKDVAFCGFSLTSWEFLFLLTSRESDGMIVYSR